MRPRPIANRFKALTALACLLTAATPAWGDEAVAGRHPGTSSSRARLGFGIELATAAAALTTGDPHHPNATGAGLALTVRVGAQLTQRLGLYYVNRAPLYVFADQMPGLGVALDCFDFNAVVLKVALSDQLAVSVGPSFDFMPPFSGNTALGGGVDARIEYALRPEHEDQRTRTTLGLDLHPSILSYNEKHGYFGYLKQVLVAGVSIGVQWR